MHIVLLSTDPEISNPQSGVFQRHEAYCRVVDSLVVFSRGEGDAITSGNFTVIPVGNSKLLWGIFAYRKAKKLKKVSVVSAQDPFEIGLLGFLIARKLKVPLHVQIHTDPFAKDFGFRFANRVRKIIMQFVFARTSCIRAVSERVKVGLGKYTSAPAFILPIFVDPKTFSPQEKESARGKKILVVSRLEPEKDVLQAIEIFALLKKRCEEATLTIAGSGSLLLKLKAHVTELGIEGSVDFLGSVSDTAQLYKEHDILLHTARYEGYGVVFVEAALSGLPIVSTDVGIAKEIGAHTFKNSGEAVLLLQESPHAPHYRYPYQDLEAYLTDWRRQFESCL